MRKLLIVLAFFILPQISHAAISFDTAAAAPDVAAGTASVSFSYTVSGANPVLIVGIDNLSNVDDIATTPPTYNGVTMTLLRKFDQVTTTRWDYVYYMLNPPVGAANNIVVTRVNTTSNLRVLAASYDGVSQINFPDASTTSGSPAGTPSATTLTSTKPDSWFIIYGENNTAVTGAGTGTTFRTNDAHTSGMLGDSNVGLSSGSHSLSLVGNASSAWGKILFSMAPALPPGIVNVRGSTIIRGSTVIR